MAERIGLALSGGGYRAAAFHIGTMRALHNMGILQKVDVISSISGGSITGAAYSLAENRENFGAFEESCLNTICTKSVTRHVLLSVIAFRTYLFILAFLAGILWCLFNSHPVVCLLLTIVFIVALLLFQFKIFPVSKAIEKAYDKFFTGGATLGQLPHRPLLAIGSTNLQTTRPFTFSSAKMGDSFYAFMKPPILFKHKGFPVSRAVAASSSVPFAFSPIQIDKEYFQNPGDFKKIKTTLIDGGVYDNQGIQKLTEKKSSYACDCVITSDAGNKLPFEGKYSNTFLLLLRTANAFMVRIKNHQMSHHIFQDGKSKTKEIAYLSLSWELSTCISRFIGNIEDGLIKDETLAAHEIPGEWTKDVPRYRGQLQQYLEDRFDYAALRAKDLTDEEIEIARKVKTGLSKLSKEAAYLLARHSENMTKLLVSLHCPSIAKPPA